jgi:hypothetical protein
VESACLREGSSCAAGKSGALVTGYNSRVSQRPLAANQQGLLLERGRTEDWPPRNMAGIYETLLGRWQNGCKRCRGHRLAPLACRQIVWGKLSKAPWRLDQMATLTSRCSHVLYTDDLLSL